MLKLFTRACLVLCGWSLTTQADVCSSKLGVNPFLYRIDKDAQHGYLLGVYNPGIALDDLPTYVRDAMRESTVQVGELKTRLKIESLAAYLMTSLHIFDRKNPGQLRRALTPEELEFLRMRIRTYGISEASIDGFSAFGAVLYAFRSAGDESEPSLNVDIEKFGQAVHHPIEGLDTPLALVRQRVKGFDVPFLKHAIAQERAIDGFAPKKPRHEELELFRAGNEDAYAAYKARWSEARPESFRHLMAERVQRWLPAFERNLSRKERPFFYIGAMQLVEPNGVLQGLRERGYTVTRVQP